MGVSGISEIIDFNAGMRVTYPSPRITSTKAPSALQFFAVEFGMINPIFIIFRFVRCILKNLNYFVSVHDHNFRISLGPI